LILVVAAVTGGVLVHRGSAQKGLLAPNPDLIKAAAAPAVVRNGLPSILESDGIFSVRRDGSTSPIVMCSTCHVLEDFTWSPSGRFLAYADTSIEVSTGDEGINIVDLRTHRRLKILRGVAFVHGLAWSRDGSKLAYAVDSDTGGSELRVIKADGSGQAVTVNTPWATPSSPTWSPDGQWLAYDVQHGGHSNVYLANLADPHQGRGLPGVGAAPAWSPDGSRIAVRGCGGIILFTPAGKNVTPARGARAVLEKSFPKPPGGAFPQPCHSIGILGKPAWSPDGKQIAITTKRDGVYVVSAAGGPTRRLTYENTTGAGGWARLAWRPRS
jgi:TolB protein